jgi:hypothetical protein
MIQQISGYRIRVANLTTVQVEKWDANHSSQGQPSGKLRYEEKKNDLVPLLEAQRNYENNSQAAKELGEMLFEVLFDDTLRNDFVLFYNDVVQKQKQILRIELDIDEQSLPEIAALPWEFMRVPQSAGIGIILLGTVPHVSLSRRRAQWIPAQPIRLGAGEKLRIALVVSAPNNLAPVDYATLEKNLEGLVTNFPEKVELLPISQGNPEAINEVLEEKPHILHFVGHGRAKNDEDEEVEELALTDPDLGDAIWVGADFISELLNTHKPALVMLQACDSGALSGKQPFFGVASRIVQQNIPVVVAMQYEVTNATANRFSRKFYEEILKGEPVDIAAQFGRRQISLGATLFNKRDFATPVIFMRVEDGNLFVNIPTQDKPKEISPPEKEVGNHSQSSSPSPPTRRPRLKGSEIGALRGIILAAFTEDQLRLLLTLRLDITYDAIRQGSGYDIAIFNLITGHFEPKGETANLVFALLQERPNDQDLQSFYAAHYQ